MAKLMQVDNAANGLRSLFYHLERDGQHVAVSRGGQTFNTRELLNVTLEIAEGNHRLIGGPLKQQKWWLAAECLTELLGLNPPLTYWLMKPETKAADIFNAMKHPTSFFQYTYGQRMAEHHVIEGIVEKLKEENSRQAVFTIWDNRDLKESQIPCTIMHQYLLRNGKLNLTVYYRSNDLYRGYRNDVYFSSVMLELMSSFTGSKIGSLTMHFGSLHSYEEDWSKFRGIDNAYDESAPEPNYEFAIKPAYDELHRIYGEAVRGNRYVKSDFPLFNGWVKAINAKHFGLPEPEVFL